MRDKQTVQQRQNVKVIIGDLPRKRRTRRRRKAPKKEEPPATRLITQFVQQFPPLPNMSQNLPLQQQPSEPKRLMPERQPDEAIDFIDRKNFVLNELAKSLEQQQKMPSTPKPASPRPSATPDILKPDADSGDLDEQRRELYDSMKVGVLRGLLRRFKIKGLDKLNKSELVQLAVDLLD